MSTPWTSEQGDRLTTLLTHFKLPTCAEMLVRRLLDAGAPEALPVLLEVLEAEAQERHHRRVERLRRASRLPPGKTFETLDSKRLPRPLLGRLTELRSGAFLERADNVLAFGLPGVGKSHALCALGHALIERGHSVLFLPTYEVVQELLAAKRNHALPRALRRFDAFEALVLDDLGYVQQTADEADVLFTLMAERYERRSLLISSNLVFSKWEQIFRSPMATAAAIDRLVHHAVILEFDVPSYRTEQARQRAPQAAPAPSEPVAKEETPVG